MDPSEDPLRPLPTLDRLYIRSTEKQIRALSAEKRSISERVATEDSVQNLLTLYRPKFSPLKDAISATIREILGEDIRGGVTNEEGRRKKLATSTDRLRAYRADHGRVEAAHKKLEKELQGHFEEYAVYECRALCTVLQDRLPRELQLTIYEALLAMPAPLPADDFRDMDTLQAPAWLARTDMITPVWLREPIRAVRSIGHWMDERFVGRDMLREMVKIWYRSTDFRFKDPGLIRRFLYCDALTKQLGEEAIPVDLIRHITVALPASPDDNDRRLHRYSTVDRNPFPEFSKWLVKGLENLFLLKPSTTFVRIFLPSSDQSWMYDEAKVQTWIRTARMRMFPVLERLKDAGYRVVVQVGTAHKLELDAGAGGGEICEEEWVGRIREAGWAILDGRGGGGCAAS